MALQRWIKYAATNYGADDMQIVKEEYTENNNIYVQVKVNGRIARLKWRYKSQGWGRTPGWWRDRYE